MKFKQFFLWFSVLIGVLIIAYIIAYAFLSKASQCKEGEVFNNQTSECYYFLASGSSCGAEEFVTKIDSKNACVYQVNNFIKNKTLKYIIIGAGISWVIIFIIFLIMITKKASPIETGFNKKDFVSADRAKEVFALHWSEHHEIPIFNDTYKRTAFRWRGGSRPTQKGQEWFLKFQVEIVEGNYQGVFTIATSLSRGEKWIKDGLYSYDQCMFHDFKIPQSWNIYTPQNAQDRLLDALYEKDPERALQLQQQAIEKTIESPEAFNQPPPEQQAMMMQQPAYRRPYSYRMPRRYIRRW